MIVAVVTLIEYATKLIGEGHTMIHSHRDTTTRIALVFLLCLLEDAAKFYQMATTTQVGSLREVAIREDIAGTQVNEVSAISELLSHCHRILDKEDHLGEHTY